MKKSGRLKVTIQFIDDDMETTGPIDIEREVASWSMEIHNDPLHQYVGDKPITIPYEGDIVVRWRVKR